MSINLPDLQSYKVNFLNKGVNYPLNTIAIPKQGLLNTLPVAINKTGWPWTEQTNPAVYPDKITWPKLTIVTPSYNQGQFIEQTIRSVLLQNYPNLEYIIIDGGSTDNTQQVLNKYSPWISYWQSEKDNGQSHAINQGFSLAKGDYMAWINSDDYYLNTTFFKVLNTFIATKTDFVYGYGLNYKIAENKLEIVQVPPLLDYFIRIPSLVQPSCFWRATIHQPLWEELHCSLDFELWQRLVKGNKRKLIKEPLSVANVHVDAKTSDPKMRAKWQQDHLKMWSADAHGSVPEWKRIMFLNRIRLKLYKMLHII